MLCSVTPNAIEFEIVRITPIKCSDAIEYIAPVIINRTQRRPGIAREKQLECLRRFAHAFVRIDFCAERMRHDQKLQTIHKHRFLELVSNAELITAIRLF